MKNRFNRRGVEMAIGPVMVLTLVMIVLIVVATFFLGGFKSSGEIVGTAEKTGTSVEGIGSNVLASKLAIGRAGDRVICCDFGGGDTKIVPEGKCSTTWIWTFGECAQPVTTAHSVACHAYCTGKDQTTACPADVCTYTPSNPSYRVCTCAY